MEVIGSVLLLIIGLMIWTIFMPVYLNIDTRKNLYMLSQVGTFHLSFYPGEKPLFKVKVFGILIPQSKTSKKSNEKRKPFLKRSIHAWIFLIKGMFKSFKIKRLVGTVDLDDVVLHSQFYAMAPFINQGNIQVTSNLDNNYYLNLIIEGRLNKMLYTFMLFLTKK